MTRKTLALLAFVAAGAGACGGKILPTGERASSEAGAPYVDPYAAQCAGSQTPPGALECTGLYANLLTKTLAPDVWPYTPAVPLWSDGAEKQRWIRLPPGSKIDTTDPIEWRFPVGTKLWKEFSRDGQRIETRLWQKVQSNYWVRTTYRWNATETVASVTAGGDVPLADGGIWHIPSGDECDQCHRGRTEHILGFEQVSLGLPGAVLTLADLVAKGVLSPPPARTQLTIGDDGTGVAAAPLGWLHINCGVTCHNGNTNATAYGASQRLRLDPALLDGRSSASFDSLTTTVNRMADTPAWAGQTRIVPGDPADSLLVKLISNRGTSNPVNNQMPPIATLIVDQPDTQNVITWISRMPHAASGIPDAGQPEAATRDSAADAPVLVDAGAEAEPGTDATADAADATADSADDTLGTDSAADDQAGLEASAD